MVSETLKTEFDVDGGLDEVRSKLGVSLIIPTVVDRV